MSVVQVPFARQSSRQPIGDNRLNEGTLCVLLQPARAGGNTKIIGFLTLLKDFGLLEASLGGSLASWSRLGTVLGPLGASRKPY